jgi:accessory gene regulator protein AgrB
MEIQNSQDFSYAKLKSALRMFYKNMLIRSRAHGVTLSCYVRCFICLCCVFVLFCFVPCYVSSVACVVHF